MKKVDVFSPFTIGNVEIPNRLILAPMAGYTDVGFRFICKKSGAGLTFTEMVSSKALQYKSKNTEELLIVNKNEKPVAVQIFGHEINAMVDAVKNPLLNKFDIIDINMGCPVPKIFRNGDGCALMKNLELASDIIQACVLASKKPISVKFRKGIDETCVNAVEFAKMCEKSGASAITIHGRTRAQMYAMENDFDIIKKVVEAVKIPVIASGDIKNIKMAQKIIHETGCAACMIGRAAVGNPEIFGKKISTKKALLLHIEKLEKHFPEKYILLNIRKHLQGYLKKYQLNPEEKKNILLSNSLAVLKNKISNMR